MIDLINLAEGRQNSQELEQESISEVSLEHLRTKVISALQQVYDPEIPVNIWDLGLIYDITITKSGDVTIQMTLTSPNCPVAEELPRQVQHAAQGVYGVMSVTIDLVWTPAWDKSRMSEEAQLALDMFD